MGFSCVMILLLSFEMSLKSSSMSLDWGGKKVFRFWLIFMSIIFELVSIMVRGLFSSQIFLVSSSVVGLIFLSIWLS